MEAKLTRQINGTNNHAAVLLIFANAKMVSTIKIHITIISAKAQPI
jgi:hypothetical protein